MRPATLLMLVATWLSDSIGLVLLRGRKVQLVRTMSGGSNWTSLAQWNSPTQC